MIKLIALDLDGTLLDNNKKIPPCHLDAINSALSKGIHVTFFTGRSRHSAMSVIRDLDFQIPMVFQNGALITKGFSKEVIRKIELNPDIAKRAYMLSKELGVFFVLYKDFFDEKDMVMSHPYEGQDLLNYFISSRWRHRYEDPLIYMEKPVAQIALVGGENKIKEILNILSEEFGENQFTPVKSRQEMKESFWEIFGYGAGKEEALRFLEDYFHVTPDEVMFVGDGYNDIGIMKMVGFPVAMDNAPYEVKRHAKYIAPSNEDCGVAWAINNIALGINPS